MCLYHSKDTVFGCIFPIFVHLFKDMEENFDYKQVPANFLRCFYEQCSCSANCLRFQVAQRATPDVVIISAINPSSVAGKNENCTFFKRDQLFRFALGITHLLDTLPHAKAVAIRHALLSHFGRNTYYRIRGKERHITPDEQSLIRELFKKEGVTEEPKFDEHIYMYNWQ